MGTIIFAAVVVIMLAVAVILILVFSQERRRSDALILKSQEYTKRQATALQGQAVVIHAVGGIPGEGAP